MPYHQFTSEERDALQVMNNSSITVSIMARILGKDVSSIYRELSRNESSGYYQSHTANSIAWERRTASKTRPKRGNDTLMREIETRFKQDHSPEQIAGRLKEEYPDNPSMHISYETIYTHLYMRIRAGEDLSKHFRHGKRKRRKRLSRKDKRGIIPNRTFIEERPSIVESKSRLGDFEGDTMEGGGKKGYIATFTDRKSKYLIAFPMKTKSATEMVQGAEKAFAVIPPDCIHTLTVDNGKEFTFHENLGVAIGADVYFAHPYHSWERGLNEHTNGLLRQYHPKKQPLDGLREKDLARSVDKLNNRPRRSLGYRTPHEVFFNVPFALQT
jgi:IS30 family transposase